MIDTTEAFQFVRQLMGTFTSLTNEMEAEGVTEKDMEAAADFSGLGI